MRRQIWDIILKIKKDCSIILSTHSMDEAQVCCQKIGIMKNGSFVTIGTLSEVCSTYAKGYNLTVNLSEANRETAERFIASILPAINHSRQIHINRSRYQFEATANEMALIFQDLKMYSAQNYITNWELGACSLFDAFHAIHDNDRETDTSL